MSELALGAAALSASCFYLGEVLAGAGALAVAAFVAGFEVGVRMVRRRLLELGYDADKLLGR